MQEARDAKGRMRCWIEDGSLYAITEPPLAINGHAVRHCIEVNVADIYGTFFESSSSYLVLYTMNDGSEWQRRLMVTANVITAIPAEEVSLPK